MKESLKKYIEYHKSSMEIKDVDPQNDCLKYICNRYELNIEQRYWIAFLFACSYSATTTFYIYNEFPDFENVNIERMERWWENNKDKTIFQTDRLRIKTQNKLTECYKSYKSLIKSSQDKFFKEKCKSFSEKENYDNLFNEVLKIKNFGRFTAFIYMELLKEICNLSIYPTRLDVKNALSCRNGLCYAFGYDDYVDKKLSYEQIEFLEKKFKEIHNYINKKVFPSSPWNIETTLCAYKKHLRGKRYVGFYIERQRKELEKIQNQVKHGVDWSVLWEFRKETYRKEFLKEDKC